MARIPPTVTTSSIPEDFFRTIRSNHPSVFRRLRIGDVADSFVEGCLADFEGLNRECIDALVEIELRSMTVNGDRGKKCEMEMHEPLVGRELLITESLSWRC